ncbi:MAG: M48 family metallopeptidase, partial [Armatimonadetes bacterium]|nr:M48 family metallopeptidase [Armatimonadota bacterium]
APLQDQSGQAEVQKRPPIKVSDPEHQKAIDNDVKLGANYSKQIAEELEFSENEEYVERVSRIGNTLAEIANNNKVKVSWGDSRLSPFNYEFYVLKGDDVNAFSVPGGYIYIYEGLIEFAETDDELAGVIAHEIAHASFRHIATMMGEQGKLTVFNIAAVLAAIFSTRDAAKILIPTSLVNQALGSGWSISAEIAADRGCVQYLMLSEYNALGALTFMERLAHQNRLSPKIDWGIYTTHKPTEERAADLIVDLRRNDVPLRRSEVTTTLRAVAKPGDGGIEVWFAGTKIHIFAGDNAQRRSESAVARLNSFFDSVPALFELELRAHDAIYGRGLRLFAVEPLDASAQGVTFEESVKMAHGTMRKSVFDLAYRIWPARRFLRARATAS